MLRSATQPVRAVAQWLSAFDPGLVRLESSLKGAAALATSLLAMALIKATVAPQLPGDAVGYAVVVAFAGALIIADPSPVARRRAVWLSVLPALLTSSLAVLLSPLPAAHAAALVALTFVAFASRRYGMRVGQLGMLATFDYYFALLFAPAAATLPWFFLGAAVATLSLYLWQFIIRPYNPWQLAGRAVDTFLASAASTAAAVKATLQEQAEVPAVGASPAARLAQAGVARRMIAQQLALLAAMEAARREPIDELRRQLYALEQGLERIVQGAEELRAAWPLPVGLQDALMGLLVELERLMTKAADGVAQHVAAIRPLLGSQERAAWRAPLVQLIDGAAQAAKAAVRVQELDPQRDLSARAQDARTVLGQSAPAPAPAQAPHLLYGMHPATVLGLQAALATGLAMVAAALMNLVHPNWTYWSAFVVIAGSTGDSLRKGLSRVGGAVGGAIFGTLLGLALPRSAVLLVVVILACFALAMYLRTVSYSWLVFWIATLVTVSYAFGGEPLGLALLVRPLNVLIGSLIGALVAVFVLPLRASVRFRGALLAYLAAAGQYLDALVGRAAEADQAGEQFAAAFDALAQTFPAVQLEYSPLSQSRSPLAGPASAAQALNADIRRLANHLGGDDPGFSEEEREQLRRNIGSLRESLAAVGARLREGHGLQPQAAPAVALAVGPAASDAARQAFAYQQRVSQDVQALSAELDAATAGHALRAAVPVRRIDTGTHEGATPRR